MDEKELPKPVLSFGFSKTKERKILTKSVINEPEIDDSKQSKIFLSEISSNQPVEEVEEKPVIPLILANKWRLTKKPEDLENDETVVESKVENVTFNTTGDVVTDDAVKEILTDAARQNQKGSDADLSGFEIPILLKNKVPDGYEMDDKLDVALRPDTDADDYETIPVEAFGFAMLRGMGWKEGDKSVKVREVRARPKGLGLAADKSVTLQVEDESKINGKDGEEKKLTMKTGSHCVIVGGKKDGQYGTIVGIDEDNVRAMVKLTLGNETVTISQYSLRLVTKKDYERGHRCINQVKVDRYKESEKQSDSRSNRRSEDRDENRDEDRQHSNKKHKHAHRDEPHDRHRDSPKKRDEAYERDRDSSKHREKNVKHDAEGSREDRRSGRKEEKKPNLKRASDDRESGTVAKKASWLFPSLRVRVVDDKFKNGKYFKAKVVIEDVVSSNSCICRTDDGKLLEDVNQDQLETVIPRDVPAYVMVVAGTYKSQMGEVLRKDKMKCEAVVQLMSDRDVALTLNFDEICEYAGNATTDFNY